MTCREKLASICQKHGILLLYLFGSKAEAGARILAGDAIVCTDPLADLDVGVVMDMITRFTTQLRKLGCVPESEFTSDSVRVAACESYLGRSLEAIFDIGRHILAKTGPVELSMEYKSIARGLVQQGIVTKELGEKLVQMAGYRNRLLHMYSEVSEHELYAVISTHLADIDDFVRQIRSYLETSADDG